MGELHDWVKYWRKTFAKCFKMHKDSRPHKHAYAELSDYLDKLEASAGNAELDAAVLWAVKFMQRMHELEKEIGFLVLDKKVPSVKPSRDELRHRE
jgi:arginine/lysine/ornithine decarboxylase